MTTAFAAKWTIYDRLHVEAQSGMLRGFGAHGGPLQVKQDNGTEDMEAVCLYPGGVLWDRPIERANEDGGTPDNPKWMVAEDDTTTWFVRLDYSGDEIDLREAEGRVTDIIDTIGALVSRNRALAGPGSRSYIVGGQGDYFPASPGHRVVLAMVAIRTQANFEE